MSSGCVSSSKEHIIWQNTIVRTLLSSKLHEKSIWNTLNDDGSYPVKSNAEH